MKYIKLYEAFESEAITNTIKFLTKKIGPKNTDSFFNDIKRLMTQYDIPISRIKEDDLEYIRVSKAIKVKNNEPVTNKKPVIVTNLSSTYIRSTQNENSNNTNNFDNIKNIKESSQYRMDGLDKLSGAIKQLFNELNVKESFLKVFGTEKLILISIRLLQKTKIKKT